MLVSHHHLLLNTQEVSLTTGRSVLALELPRPGASSDGLETLAKALEAAGADALVVRTDAEDTPSGLADLLRVLLYKLPGQAILIILY